MRYFMKHLEKGGTSYFITGKKREHSKEDVIFFFFLLGMAVYYGYRLFALTPWYDELYTYYYFISRGPVYAAIHWPLPNNHVGYSALSACLGIFGSAPVALRGVSWLCSLGSLTLLYRLSKKCFAKGTALIPVFLFAGMYMVNQLAVQGRGYALVTFCYVTALTMLYSMIVENKNNKRYYICFGLSMVIAVWAVPSSLYVVMPLCLIGGFLLLLQKDYRRLLRLIAVSLISAVCVAGLYGILWLAIGSNLLSKTPDGSFYGAGHIEIILHAPLRSLSEGITYMLDSPYIQSMTKEEFQAQASHWLQTLFGNQLAPTVGLTGRKMCILLVLVLLLAVWQLIRKRGKTFWEWYLVLTPFLLTIALLIQCKLPYQRVFSFLSVWVALLLGWLTQLLFTGKLYERMQGSGRESVVQICSCLLTAAAGLSAGISISDVSPYSLQDALLAETYNHVDIRAEDVIAVTDCDQEYMLFYFYGIQGAQVTRDIREADIVLLDKALLGLPYGHREAPEAWKFYFSEEEIEAQKTYLQEEMIQSYENWGYVLYEKKP